MGRKRAARPARTAAEKQTPIIKVVKPRTINQSDYYKAIFNNVVTFGLGPAGTGKTFLAVAAAANALISQSVSKIVLVRPAVEAGEKLGFLPGDLEEKINPYLRPLFDSLNDILDPRVVLELMATEIIEVAPLAFMRGRTLKNAVIILDEAQNATATQLKMFLTRIGENSRAIITGDPSQNDLGWDQTSGLMDAVARLSHIDGVAVHNMTKTDIVRHPIVQKIVDAYS